MHVDKLTPRGIALGHLIDLFATADVALEVRQALAILLVEQVSQQSVLSAIEPSLQELRAELTPLTPQLRDEFERRILDTTEPDDLWDLMGSLGELLEPTLMSDTPSGAPIQLERSSMLGLFVRRIRLAFRNTSFEEVCTLVTHFGQWVQAGDGASSGTSMATAAAMPKTPTEAVKPTAVVGENVDPLLASLDEPFPAHLLTPSGVPSALDGKDAGEHGAGGEAPPAYAYVLPASQLEAHVLTLAQQMEEGSVSASSPATAAQIKQLLELAPHVPQVCGNNTTYSTSRRAFLPLPRRMPSPSLPPSIHPSSTSPRCPSWPIPRAPAAGSLFAAALSPPRALIRAGA